MSRKHRRIWFIILGITLALRFGGLAQAPLSPGEARAALASLDAVRGNGWTRETESTLLLMGNTLLFAFFGAGEGIARFWPALTGVAFVMLPLLWRKRLGDVGALVATGILVCSPLVLFASRQVSGTLPGIFGAALLFTVFFARSGYLDVTESKAQRPYQSTRFNSLLIACGIFFVLTGGAEGYTLLIAGALTWLLYRWMAETKRPVSFGVWLYPALIGLLAAWLLSIGFGMRLGGLDGLAAGAAAWFKTWRVNSAPNPGGMLLLVYEPLTLLLALLGLGLTARRNHALPPLLGIWAALAVFLTVFRVGASPVAWATMVFPMALLAGYAIERIVADVPSGTMKWLWGLALAGFIFWQPVGLTLAGYTNNLIPSSNLLILILGALVLLVLQALIAFMFAFVIPQSMIWRGSVLGIAMAFLVMQVSFAWGLAFVRPDSPAELAVPVAGSPDLRMLPLTLDELAVQRNQRRDTLSITLLEGRRDFTAMLRWALRDFPRVAVQGGWPAQFEGIVLTPEDFAPEASPVSEYAAVGWEGMRFVVMTQAPVAVPACQSFSPFECKDWVRWYLYRQFPVNTITSEYVILWAKSDTP